MVNWREFIWEGVLKGTLEQPDKRTYMVKLTHAYRSGADGFAQTDTPPVPVESIPIEQGKIWHMDVYELIRWGKIIPAAPGLQYRIKLTESPLALWITEVTDIGEPLPLEIGIAEIPLDHVDLLCALLMQARDIAKGE